MLFTVANTETPLTLSADQEEYREKCVDMIRTFKSLQAIFEHIRYAIKVGAEETGEYAAFKHVEGTVYLDWGPGVPGSFKLRTFMEGEATMGVVDATKRAMSRVFSYCVERAETPHTDSVRRLMAVIVEARALLTRFRRSLHIDMTMTPRVEATPYMEITVVAWVDDQQFMSSGDAAASFDEAVNALRTGLVDFLASAINDTLDTEVGKRMPRAVAEPVHA